jgi:hypothetical protein
MTRRPHRRPPTPEERLETWTAFLESCSEDERARYLALAGRLRAGYQERCALRAVTPHFGPDGAAELMVALVQFLQTYRRTCEVRKGV